jgi:6-phosphogluconolactonase
MEERLSITVYQTTTDLEQNAAEEITRVMNTAIGERGRCFVALAGGETPRQIYRRLGMEPLKDRVNWNHVHLFFSDERSVPPNDPQSNYGMVKRTLLSGIDIPGQNVHRIKGELDATVAAQEYESDLKSTFGNAQVRFDLMLLGVGEDGHVASMFPGTNIVLELSALVQPVMNPNQNIQRVTLTFPVINNAREILLLVSGKRKSSIVQRVLNTSGPTKDLPATMVRPAGGNVRWLLDQEAASEIDPTTDVALHR